MGTHGWAYRRRQPEGTVLLRGGAGELGHIAGGSQRGRARPAPVVVATAAQGALDKLPLQPLHHLLQRDALWQLQRRLFLILALGPARDWLVEGELGGVDARPLSRQQGAAHHACARGPPQSAGC